MSAATPHVAPDPDAARDTARLPTTVMPLLSRPGSCLFGLSGNGPSPTSAPCPTTTSLSRIERSTTAPERMTESNMMIESRTTAPTPTRTPGDSTELTTVPSMTQPWLMRLRCTWAVGPTLAGARSSDRVWMIQSLSYRSSCGSSARSAMLASQYDWIVPTSCQ